MLDWVWIIHLEVETFVAMLKGRYGKWRSRQMRKLCERRRQGYEEKKAFMRLEEE